MALIWEVNIKLKLVLLLWLPALYSPSQAREFYGSKYPFIKRASTYSSSSSYSSSGGGNSYDYIVVGGGTAGCPMAATLSHNYSVLLLERGGVPFTNANVSFLKNFHITLADISSTSASQCFISTDGVLNARARVLGGGSAINAGFYTRASHRFIKNAGWDEKLVNESYPWVESQIVHKPKSSAWQDALQNGLLEQGVDPFNGFTYDHIYGTKIGGTIFDRFGRRHTAAELLASANPRRLTVLVHATVQKVMFDTSGERPKTVGVIFKDEKGNQHQAFLSNSPRSEVILSTGAIGTPQILMLSGIGPKAELSKLNIPIVLENEFVGKGMADNPMNTIFVPTKEPVEQSLIQTVGITKFGVYIEASSGFGQSNDSFKLHHGIVSAEIGQLSTIPPKQRSFEAIRAFVERKKDIPYEAFKGGFILSKIAKPISAGHLNLINKNVDDNPSVTFNYFSHPQDLKRCVEGIRTAARIVQSGHYQNFTQSEPMKREKILNISVGASVNLIPRHINDTESVEQFCKDTVITIWHYHGGAHVGRVVSPDYKVLGVDRLRIVDGSVYNDSPGTNPQATVMMMGRYMGMKILRDRRGRASDV